jgi:hypothetical protein
MTAGQSLSQVELGIDLDDGFLQLGPIAGVGPRGGRYTANAELAPAGMEYRMELQLTLEEARLDLSRGRRDPSEWAPIDIQLDLAATGRSPHGLLSSTDGWLVLAVGAAPLDTRIIDNLGTGLFAQILDQMNPFRKEDPTADLECAVIVTTFTDGVARIDPLALRTNKATVIGNGRINFKNERLDLAWAIKPRKGVGLSASTLTNPYVKLGGTLSDPALELKPLDAVATTGAAVATGGLWILGRGLWDRVSAEKQVCDQAFRAAERRVAAQK